jgi:hypothetical protein
MAGNRWDNLDFDPPSSERGRAATSRRGGPHETTADLPDDRKGAESATVPPVPSSVMQAQNAYAVRNYQMVIDLLESRLESQPDLAGGQRVLAQALARLNREEAAAVRLREAVRQSTNDWLARASLASLLLGASEQAAGPSPAALL